MNFIERLPYCVDNRLHLTVMPTEQCNFRCRYCYEDFALPRMSLATVEALERFIDRRAPGLDVLELSWFGGEPLLELETVQRVQGHVQSLASRGVIGRFRSSMTTNASLLSVDRLECLVDLGLREFQITLDGPAEHHDQLRVTRAGGGTFDRIWKNLSAAFSTDLPFFVTLRLHVNSRNGRALERLLQSISSSWPEEQQRLEIFLRPLAALGGPNDDHLPLLGAGADQVTERLRAVAERVGLRVRPTGSQGPSVCYAAAANAYVVRSDGSLSKCSLALTSRHNQVGRLRPDGSLEIDHEKMGWWTRGLWTGREKDLHCPHFSGHPVATSDLVELSTGI